MATTVLQSCSLIDLTIKTKLQDSAYCPALSWVGALKPSSVGSSSLQDETQGCLDLLFTTRPKCFDQDANLRNNHGY